MLTTEQQQTIYRSVGMPVVQAAIAINFAARYASLLARFPKQADRFSDQDRLPLERKKALVDGLGLPLRYYKSDGGYWRLNEKKYPRGDISLQVEMMQWVKFSFSIKPEGLDYRGGFYQNIYIAQRMYAGEVLDFREDWLKPNSPWCYSEADFSIVLTECAALFNDLVAELPAGISEGWGPD
jgi:hypothetical protein